MNPNHNNPPKKSINIIIFKDILVCVLALAYLAFGWFLFAESGIEGEKMRGFKKFYMSKKTKNLKAEATPNKPTLFFCW